MGQTPDSNRGLFAFQWPGKTLLSWNSFIKGSSELSKSNFVPAVWHNGEVSGQHYRFQAG
ncbi:MAG: hypothetical protein ACYCV7_10795 [Acidimicrobiales bacterium]